MQKNTYPLMIGFLQTSKYCISFFLVKFPRKVLYQACQVYSLSFSHLKKNSKENTKHRTTKAVLKEQNKWIEIEELVATVNEEYSKVIHLQEKTSILSFFLLFICIHLKMKISSESETHFSYVFLPTALLSGMNFHLNNILTLI
jgi:hypothetical protein